MGVAFYTTSGSIPLVAIRCWAELHGFDRASTLLLIGVIQHLDRKRSEVEQKRRELAAAQGARR